MSEPHHSPIGSCAACGTSPVNHRSFKIASYVETFVQPIFDTTFGLIKVPTEGIFTNAVTAAFFGALKAVGLVRFGTDSDKANTGRSKLIWDEAIERGIPMEQVILLGKPFEQYRAKISGRWIYFQSIPTPYWLPYKGYALLDDKFWLSETLRKAGIAAPLAARVGSWNAARKAFDRMQKPVIVKPASGSRGRHTTTHITTLEQLRAAYDMGREIAVKLVVEEHLFGSVYRATVMDGKLVGFFRADPPRVIGDGTSTVTQLIEARNASRPERISDIQVNDDVIGFIARRGYTLESVVPGGEVLDLTAKTGRLYGGYTREMLPEVHPRLREILVRAGDIVRASIVGFDLIIPDPTQDPDAQRWGIIECNSMPFIDLHFFAFEGTPLNLAKNVWDIWQQKFPERK